MAGSIWDWSTTPANNATADAGINWAEGQAPSTVNNSARVMMERVKELMGDLGGINTATGTGNVVAVTTTSPFTAYSDGIIITFRAAANNTGAATINANAIGAKPVYKSYVNSAYPLVGGEIALGAIVEARYVAALNGAAGGWLLSRTEGKAENVGVIFGLTTSNNAGDAVNDIDIAPGNAAADDLAPVIMTLGSTITKRLDAAWAVGTNQGGLDTGSIANNTYYVWLIQRSDTGVVDILFSASAASPTMPANYDRKRRIAPILRELATIIPYKQTGDEFIRANISPDSAQVNPGTSAVTVTLAIPNLLELTAIVNVSLSCPSSAGSGVFGLISAFAQTDVAPSTINANITATKQVASSISSGQMLIRTKNDRTIRSRVSFSDATIQLNIGTVGWIDTRGRLA